MKNSIRDCRHTFQNKKNRLMKTTFCITLLTLVMFTFVLNSFAQDDSPEYVVRVIYFIPNDREPQPDMDTRLDKTIKDAQKFYANQMEAHGFGRKTFRFEVDQNENLVVHHVNGKFNDVYYQTTGNWIVWTEIEELFDHATSKNIYLLALDISSDYLDRFKYPNINIYGYATGTSLRGLVLVPASNHSAVIHELGHAFGLDHDSRINGKRIFTNRAIRDWMTTSFCAAQWLDVHRYFNPTQETFNDNTSVQMLAPSRTSSPFDVQLRFKITDSDGLHQARLFKAFGTYPSTIDYQKLNGESDTVEFVTSELANGNWIGLSVMDGHGNFTFHRFAIDVNDLLPQPKEIQIPDPILATLVRKTLSLKPEDAITQIDMLSLTELAYPHDSDSKITDLSGLEHAINLGDLRLIGNQIQDITPLTALTKLTNLHIGGNPINDITPLAKLTNLQKVGLADLQISDITLLEGLTNLYSLWIPSNKISNITPLAGLKNLRELYLIYNPIKDIASLTELTNLYELSLSGNQINDISSLKTLTGLRILRLADNQINNVSPLTGLVNLKELGLEGNPIKDKTPLFELLKKNPDIKIYLKWGGEPLPVNLSHFGAERTDAGVILRWTTESEVDNAGFYIYRSQTKDSEFRIVNPRLIQGAGTTGERNEYTWTDTTAKPNTVYYYRIEDVSQAGVREQLATVRLRGLVSARGKLPTNWASLKARE